MADFLVYWKYFWRTTREDPNAVGDYWHTARESFFKQIKPGDRIWVVVTGGEGRPNQWRLLQRIVVRRKGTNLGSDWPYEVVGDKQENQRFDTGSQTDLSAVLRRLEFASGNRIRFRGAKIGKTLQSPRRLSERDGHVLLKYSRQLLVYGTPTNNAPPDQPHASLIKLVEHVFRHRDGLIKGVTYETLAAWIGRTNKYGVGHAHGMGDVLGKMGHLLQDIEGEWGEPIPHLQSLVVRKSGPYKDLPDQGIREFWREYPKLSRAEKVNKVRAEYERIVGFGSRWNDVLAKLNLPKVLSPKTPRGMSRPFGGYGESAQHKAFKEFVRQHPEIVGARRDWEGHVEYSLPSQDQIDVVFKSSEICIAAEVKSSVSDNVPQDYERGLYQTIKYGALLKAMALDGKYSIPSSIRSVLVLESILPPQYRELAEILGVVVIEKARN